MMFECILALMREEEIVSAHVVTWENGEQRIAFVMTDGCYGSIRLLSYMLEATQPHYQEQVRRELGES